MSCGSDNSSNPVGQPVGQAEPDDNCINKINNENIDCDGDGYPIVNYGGYFPPQIDCDDSNPYEWQDCDSPCIDQDGDGYVGTGCDKNVDAYDSDPEIIPPINKIISSIPVSGEKAGKIAISPDGNHVYVSIPDENALSVIKTVDNKVIKTIPVGSNPDSIVVTPNSEFVYVSNSGSDTVSVIRAFDNSIISTITVGKNPKGAAVLPSGEYVYVANYESKTISVIQVSDNTVVETIQMIGMPFDMEVTPDGNFIWIVFDQYGASSRDDVAIIQTSDNSITGYLLNWTEEDLSVWWGPLELYEIAFSPDGERFYISGYREYDGYMKVFRVSDLEEIEETSIYGGLDNLLRYPVLSPDGKFVYFYIKAASPYDHQLAASPTSLPLSTYTFRRMSDYDSSIRMKTIQDLSITPDGNYIYAPSPGLVYVLGRYYP